MSSSSDRARSFELPEREVAEVAEHLRTTEDDRALQVHHGPAPPKLVRPCPAGRAPGPPGPTGVADEAMRFLIRDADRADLCRDTLLEWLADEGEFGLKPLEQIAIRLSHLIA